MPEDANDPDAPARDVQVSVIVPAFNDSERLGRCLKALAAQDTQDFDINVIDDCSTDGGRTAAVAETAGARVLRLDRNVGPAIARNRGARAATGNIFFFIDADCLAHPDAVSRVATTLAGGSPYDATFGSYGLHPESPALVSRWKNLSHRHTHQLANEEAATFWSGCGAIRRDVFLAFGGFDETYGRPCIEDVELGMRLKAAGRRIKLDKLLQVEHLKRWRLWNLVKTDVFDRGVPWTRVLLAAGKDGAVEVDDLNVGGGQKLAAVAAAAFVGLFLVGAWWRPWLALVPVAALIVTVTLDALTARGVSWRRLTPLLLLLVGAASLWFALYAPLHASAALLFIATIVGINCKFYHLLLRRCGLGFAVAGFVPHVIYYLCALVGFALGNVSHLLRPRVSLRPAAPAEAAG